MEVHLVVGTVSANKNANLIFFIPSIHPILSKANTWTICSKTGDQRNFKTFVIIFFSDHIYSKIKIFITIRTVEWITKRSHLHSTNIGLMLGKKKNCIKKNFGQLKFFLYAFGKENIFSQPLTDVKWGGTYWFISWLFALYLQGCFNSIAHSGVRIQIYNSFVRRLYVQCMLSAKWMRANNFHLIFKARTIFGQF